MRFLIFTAVLFGIFSTPMLAQDVNSQNVLINYSFLLGADVVDAYDSTEPATEREVKLASRVTQKRNAAFKKQAFEMIKEELQKGKTIALMPLETLEGKVAYNDEGYPIPMMVKRALKKKIPKGTADYYFSVGISISKALIPGLTGIKPESTVTINIFNPAGEKITNASASVKAEEFIKIKDFPEGTFDKMDEDHTQPFIDLFMPNVKAAAIEAIKEI
ncbi:MAG: hypothetical protein AAGG68_12800 [Bacteroidota bacterium]